MQRHSNLLKLCIVLLVLACGCGAASASTSNTIGGDRAWYVFHCHADGTEISLDNEIKGVITDGELSVPVYTTGTPYKSYTATYDQEGFHQSVTRPLTKVPVKGEVMDIYVDISPVPTPHPTYAPKPIGGDQGWYDIYCNVPGATVSFDGEVKGVISDNVLVVPVYTTGTPYKTITVSAPDYVTASEPIDQHPGNGETVDLYITLNRENDIPMIS
ncbi:hypothetical protein [uncultured Methanospirillum sp.]|uniref:hypothetical protein n=1 Tax=uncultured Methanospirillum sp. TaxID=262503 RepID=UPI0029C87B73|nr:hypothetical protein [uncultured Methanospirillum sp.]